MTIQTTRYIRKPFFIDAVQVTADNIDEVAEWCTGSVHEDERKKNIGEDYRYVKVRVHRPLSERQTKAFVGDWVLYAGTGYRVYTDKAFVGSFEPAPDVEEAPDYDELPFNEVPEVTLAESTGESLEELRTVNVPAAKEE